MNAPIFISTRVINTINALPQEDRIAVASAIAGELILGAEIKDELTPMQNLAFTIIRSYVMHDTNRIIPEA